MGSNWITGRFKTLAETKLPEVDPTNTPQILQQYPEIVEELRKEVEEKILQQLSAVNKARVEQGQTPLDLSKIGTLIGVGGTAETLGAVINEQTFDNEPVWMLTDGVNDVTNKLYQATIDERRAMGVDSDKRAKKIPAGALILGEVLSALGAGRPAKMMVSPYDLRDGLVAKAATESQPHTKSRQQSSATQQSPFPLAATPAKPTKTIGF